MHTIKVNGTDLELRCLTDGMFRVRVLPNKLHKESMLTRYGILKEPEESFSSSLDGNTVTAGNFKIEINDKEGTLTFNGMKEPLTVKLPSLEDNCSGFELQISLNEKERLYGMGDVNRTTLNKRGTKSPLWVTNVVSYGPFPYVMSSRGWAVAVNCTYRQEYDLGATDKNLVSITAEKGLLDFYVFLTDRMVDTLELYTRLTGRPVMLPRSAYGFTSVCNENYNVKELLDESLNYRREDIPCDIIGLEPYWMEKYYDFSTEKKWDPVKFYMPYWRPANQTGAATFFHCLRRMGIKLSLWLCCDYDLLWEEEKSALEAGTNSFEGATVEDVHLASDIIMDQITKPNEPWFEHLKKFVDNGAAAFKLDGANQVLQHPDRIWAGKYLDEEVHNVYTVILSKQMNKGFENYTNRRSMIYTAGSFLGTQQYAATWAGDTGGSADSLVSILNLAMCGHTNTSCDMDVNSPLSMHYCFLMPWTQYCGWCSLSVPWYMGDEIEDMWRKYSKLRSAIFPYIYSMAHKANKTALPIARPFCLMYPEDEAIANTTNAYMFGDSLAVVAFDMNARLPEGNWYDLFTGKIYEGGKDFTYEIPEGFGGGLFAKCGSLFVTQEPKPYLDSPIETEFTIQVFPGADAEFTMIQDDGVTLDYRNGEVAETYMAIENWAKDGFDLVLNKRTGGYTIKSEEKYNISNMSENHSSNVRPLPEVSGFNVAIHTDVAPKSVSLNGKTLETTYEYGILNFKIEKELHEKADLRINIKF